MRPAEREALAALVERMDGQAVYWIRKARERRDHANGSSVLRRRVEYAEGAAGAFADASCRLRVTLELLGDIERLEAQIAEREAVPA